MYQTSYSIKHSDQIIKELKCGGSGVNLFYIATSEDKDTGSKSFLIVKTKNRQFFLL